MYVRTYLQAAHDGGCRIIAVMKGGYSYHLTSLFSVSKDEEFIGTEDGRYPRATVSLTASRLRSHSTKSIMARAKARERSSERHTVRCCTDSDNNGSTELAVRVTYW